VFFSVSGDDDKKQKVALYILCHLLAKKGSEDAMGYIYEKYKVSYSYNHVTCWERPRLSCKFSVGGNYSHKGCLLAKLWYCSNGPAEPWTR